MRRGGKGQSIFEYAVIISIVVAGLLAMRIYMKRAIEGRLRGSMDEVGELYSPRYVTSKFTTEQKEDIVEIETFGLDPRTSTTDVGVSITEVVTPSEVVRCATGPDAEKITIDFKKDPLFE